VTFLYIHNKNLEYSCWPRPNQSAAYSGIFTLKQPGLAGIQFSGLILAAEMGKVTILPMDDISVDGVLFKYVKTIYTTNGPTRLAYESPKKRYILYVHDDGL